MKTGFVFFFFLDCSGCRAGPRAGRRREAGGRSNSKTLVCAQMEDSGLGALGRPPPPHTHICLWKSEGVLLGM